MVWCNGVRYATVLYGSQEARLERAEGAEVKRQLREALAELESDRSSQARRARNNVQVWRERDGAVGDGGHVDVAVLGYMRLFSSVA